MTGTPCRLVKANIQTAILLGGLALTACAPRYSAPVQVAASNPTVTYQYRNDAELLQANQNAAGYCSQYQASPRQVRFAEGPQGRAVVFECVQGPAVAYGPAGVVAPVAYDSYYDDFYGPYYDGYWGPDGFYYFSDGPGHPYRRDELHHFRHDMVAGYHGVRGAVHG